MVRFTVNNGVLEKYSGNESVITIPEGVTEIAAMVFQDHEELKSVILPEGLLTIGESAFANCYGLTNITIPEGVESIGDSAFRYCHSLTDIKLPNSLREIGRYAFDSCKGLTYIDIPLGLKKITWEAFSSCSGLHSVTIPETVTEIQSEAFSYCSNLKSVTLPKSITSLGKNVFYRTGLSGIDEKFFIIDNCLCAYSGQDANVVIPDQVRVIADDVFYKHCEIQSVTIPNSVTNIGSYVFQGCNELKNITIPESVTDIGNFAFEGCIGLKSITLPNSVRTIGYNSFSGCTSLTSVTIPGNVNVIDSSAFSGCTGLTDVTISDGVKCIGRNAFYECSNLKEITLPDSITQIGREAFKYCARLTHVTIPAGVENIEWGTFECTGLTEAILSEGLRNIEDRVFYGCTGLTKVTLSEGLRNIGIRVFYGCTGLNDITIPAGVQKIGNGAFDGCTGLSNITLSEGLQSIGESSFDGCSCLTSIIIPSSVTSIGSGAFRNCNGLTSISIPAGIQNISSSVFQGCTGLSGFEDKFFIIDTYLVAYHGNEPEVEIPSQVETISDYVFENHEEINNIIIPNGLTNIGSMAFAGCSGLTSINIPDSVTNIGAGAFYGCKALSSISLPDSIVEIQDSGGWNSKGTFEKCIGLTEVIIPYGLRNIGRNAFKSCRSLKNISIPDSVTNIGKDAFCGCSGLDNLIIPNTVTTVGVGAFSGCSGLVNISIPGEITELKDAVDFGEKGTFEDCKYLTDVSISDGLFRIGSRSFKGCTNLSHISIPNSVTSIGSSAFSGCSNLMNVIIPNSVTSIENGAFSDCTNLMSVELSSSLPRIENRAFSGCIKLTNITIPESVTEIGHADINSWDEIGVFSDCSELTTVTIKGPTEISGYTFAGCKNLETIKIENNKCKIKRNAFGDRISYGLVSQFETIYSYMEDSALVYYVLNEEVWNELSPESQADIFLNRQSKVVKDQYHNCITQENASQVGRAIVGILSGNPSSKLCDGAAAFISLYYSMVPRNITEEIYEKLKISKTGKKAVKVLDSDAGFTAFMNEKPDEENNLPMVEQKVMQILQEQNLTFNVPELNLKQYYGLTSNDLPVIVDKEGNEVSDMVKSWLLTVHEGWKQYSGNRGELKEVYKAAGICPSALEVIDMLDPESLWQALMKLADENLGGMGKRLGIAFPICRYADEKMMDILTKRAPQWRSGTSGNDAPPLSTFRSAAKYSTTKAALFFAEKYSKEGDLSQYAEIRGMDEDAVRDQLIADTGLDGERSKTYDLGNQVVKVRLQKDLNFTIELPDGKTAKSLPKKNADPDKFASANEDFSALKKNIKKIIKNRINSLFDDFLEAKQRKAESWRGSYMGNMLLRDIACLLVWDQDGDTFTLTETGIIDSAGKPYTLSDKKICLAYPAEMEARDLAAWQNYFTSNNLKQPFLQLWEPVRDLNGIKPDRYKGDLIPYYRFLHQEKHGISIQSSYDGQWIDYEFKGCVVELEQENYSKHWNHIEPNDLFEITKIEPRKSGYESRYANHIVAYLDRITIWERIQKDDTAIIDLLPQFTAAQINEFISIATEAHAVNVTAMLMEYKNTNYPDLDPLAEFTLDL